MTYVEYIKESIEGAFDSENVEINCCAEKLNNISKLIESSLEQWSMYSGNEVFDKNRNEDIKKEIKANERNKIISTVMDLMGQVGSANSRVFDLLTHNQKLALSQLYHLDHYLLTQGI